MRMVVQPTIDHLVSATHTICPYQVLGLLTGGGATVYRSARDLVMGKEIRRSDGQSRANDHQFGALTCDAKF